LVVIVVLLAEKSPRRSTISRKRFFAPSPYRDFTSSILDDSAPPLDISELDQLGDRSVKDFVAASVGSEDGLATVGTKVPTDVQTSVV
jgi:hypothetical protein